jgi:amidohydrolase
MNSIDPLHPFSAGSEASMSDLVSEAEQLINYTKKLRWEFHMHPELGFQEFHTSKVIAEELSCMGLEVQTGIAKTGVVALMQGKEPGPVIMVRADMDALPINEVTGAQYASLNSGVMHACGHDGHVAILLTVAQLLNKNRDRFAGSVKFIFQPAEEGLFGAEKMIAEGVLENPVPDYCLGLHIWNEKPIGWLGIANGPAMAGAEKFKVVFHGKGGHGASPHLAVDPVIAASQTISALQSIVARNVPPLHPAVISVCTIRGGEAFNVIPNYVEISGTIRTFEPEVRDLVMNRFRDVVSETTKAMNCQADIDLERLTPATINDPRISSLVQSTALRWYPPARIERGNYLTMVSEDFAFFLEKVPGCFILVGSSNPDKGLNASHHNPKFDFDEQVLPQAAALLAASVIETSMKLL